MWRLGALWVRRSVTRHPGVYGRPFTAETRPEPWPRGTVDRFGGVSVRLKPAHPRDEASFRSWLQDAIKRWKEEGRIAVWLHIPISLSGLIACAAIEGFTFHHAEHNTSTLTLWLKDGPNRLPGYATHQVGVAGAVFDEDTGKVLVVQDRNKPHTPISSAQVPLRSFIFEAKLYDTTNKPYERSLSHTRTASSPHAEQTMLLYESFRRAPSIGHYA